MANLPPHIPRLVARYGDDWDDQYPYSKLLKEFVLDGIPVGLPLEELETLANRLAGYLGENRGQKITFEKLVNLNNNGQLVVGGSRRRKSKKASKKKSSKKTKTQVGGAKKRKSKKTSKKSSKKTSRK